MAQRLGVDEDFLLTLSVHEHGWADPHNDKLHNLFGTTKAGGNNLSYASDEEAAQSWEAHYGGGPRQQINPGLYIEAQGDGVQLRGPGLRRQDGKHLQDSREVQGVMRRSLTAALIAAAVALPALAAQPLPGADPLARYDEHGTSGMTRVTGQTYINEDYGFSVRVPAGEVALMNKAPGPNHGVRLYLGRRRSIELDASFDSALLGSTEAVAEAAAGYASGGEALKSQDMLGRREAERIVQYWRKAGRWRIIVARWDDAGGAGDAINITLTLETTSEAYEEDKRVFDALVRSFRFVARGP